MISEEKFILRKNNLNRSLSFYFTSLEMLVHQFKLIFLKAPSSGHKRANSDAQS